VIYWESHAEYDIKTAKQMFNTKRYPYVLFMCHLSIEKLLKGIYVTLNYETPQGNFSTPMFK